MADLFGAPTGIHQGIQDINYMQKAPLELAKLHQQVEQGNIKTQMMQMDLKTRQKMMAALSHLGEQGMQIRNPADLSDALANMWLQAGDPDKAMKGFADAEVMRNHAANTQAALGRKKLEDLQAHEKMVNYEIGQLQGVSNQQELDALTARMESQFKEPPPWKGQAYSPELKDKIARTVLGVKDALRLELDESKLSWQKEYQSSMLAMKEAQLRLAKSREERLKRAQTAKEGKVSEPIGAQVNQASAVIRLAHPSFTSAPEDMQTNIATKAAEDARALMAKNKGLRFTDAVQQALANPETSKDLKAIADAQFAGRVWNRVRGATPPENEEPSAMQGITSANPLPYSSDPDSYIEGNWYYDKQGVPRFYKDGMFYTAEELK